VQCGLLDYVVPLAGTYSTSSLTAIFGCTFVPWILGGELMATWAIAYDLDVGAMKRNSMTKGEVTAFYRAVRDCLTKNNFESFKQLSIYTSDKENTLTNAFKACQALASIPNSATYVKRLHLFRLEDNNDLLPLVSGKSSAGRDAVEDRIDEVFEEVAPGLKEQSQAGPTPSGPGATVVPPEEVGHK
jgi:virulence-associated protein VapD